MNYSVDYVPYLVFIIPIAAGILAQATKFILFVIRHGWQPRYVLTHGHMPSAHTAFAISLLISVGYFEGAHSGEFAVAVALGFIIIDDALRIRMILGDQGRYLNMLIEQLQLDKKNFPRLKERVGHRVNEVVAGGLFGLIVSLVMIWLFA